MNFYSIYSILLSKNGLTAAALAKLHKLTTFSETAKIIANQAVVMSSPVQIVELQSETNNDRRMLCKVTVKHSCQSFYRLINKEHALSCRYCPYHLPTVLCLS